jgi:hypothetical protein
MCHGFRQISIDTIAQSPTQRRKWNCLVRKTPKL